MLGGGPLVALLGLRTRWERERGWMKGEDEGGKGGRCVDMSTQKVQSQNRVP